MPGRRREVLRIGVGTFAAGWLAQPALTFLSPRSVAGASGDVAGGTPAPPAAFLPAEPAVESYHQKWALSCEYAATHIALRILGVDVSEDVMRALLGSGEDPDVTFRGNIDANQDLDNYGVHARGIARLLALLKSNEYVPDRLQTELLHDADGIRGAVAAGRPVVAWVPLDLRPSSRVPVLLSTGKIVNLVYAEHTVVVRGYDGERVLALDPHAGAPVAYSAPRFWQAMSLFDDPALAIGLASPALASETFPETGITLEGGFYRTYLELGGRSALGVPVTTELYEPDVTTGAPKMVVYTEAARLEWYPQPQSFGLGFVGQELLGSDAMPDPDRRPRGAIGRYVAANGGLSQFGYAISEEVPFSPDDPLLPEPADEVVGQWFQTELLLWSPRTGVLPGRPAASTAPRTGLIPVRRAAAVNRPEQRTSH